MKNNTTNTTKKSNTTTNAQIKEEKIMTTNTLSINFYAENITTDAKVEFMQAIAHENYEMTIQLLNDTIAKLEKKIVNDNGTYTDEEVQAFQVQLDSAIETRTEFEEKSASTLEVYNKVVDTSFVKLLYIVVSVAVFCLYGKEYCLLGKTE